MARLVAGRSVLKDAIGFKPSGVVVRQSCVWALLLSLAYFTGCIDAPSGSGGSTTPEDMGGDQGADMMVEPPIDMPADMPVDMTDPPDLPDPEDMPEDMTEPVDMQDMSPGFDCSGDDDLANRGDGSPAAPFILCDADDFASMNNSTSHYVLGQDIDVTGGWEPIPNFGGHFDGQGFEIKGLYLDNGTVERALRGCSAKLAQRYESVNGVYVGGFITTLAQTAVIQNVDFADVQIGQPDPRIQYIHRIEVPVEEGDPEEVRCYPLIGGLFGVIDGSDEASATLENIRIRGLEAYVGGLFGGVAFDANFTTIRNVHLMKSEATGEVPSIDIENTDASGFIVHAVRPTITSSSARVTISMSGGSIASPHVPAGVHADTALFIGYLIGGVLERVAAKGEISRAGERDGNITGVLGGLIGTIRTPESASDVKISDCIIDVSIAKDSSLAGGLIGRAAVFHHPLSIRRCGVGFATSPSSVSSHSASGALMGELDEGDLMSTENALELHSSFFFANVGTANAGCYFGSGAFDMSTFSIDDRDNKPDFAEPMNVMGGIKSCSASSFLDALTGDDLERLGWVRRSNNAVVPALLEPMLDEIGFFDQGN